ncbi:hypothetical protein CIB95_00430 [Lottiidibacillus patelloidae]|uniref:Uncharacterized protein n=1 Tax=Lottiidibacillus patelloidae TaxID=2670334 RepID=A0A263BWP1_9BACI|nr:endospore germination permease [Lottiidibacillus patelloidae]OZM58080.1 hypothetical protein CIB95_00430 [Lottiidibacillus patelloidae]
MKKLDGKLGTREFVALLLLTISLKVTDSTPTILLGKGENASWMLPIISASTILIPFLFLLSLLKKYKDKNIVEIGYSLTGNIFGFIIGMTLFLMMFVGTIANSRSYVEIISPMFFTTTPVPFLYILLLFVGYFVANRGFETIGRTAWLIVPYISVALALLVIFVWTDLDPIFLFPIAGPGLKELVLSGVKNTTIFGELILIGVIYPFLRSYKTFKNGALLSLILTTITLSLFLAIYVMAFSFPPAKFIAFPFQNLTRMAQVGEALEHSESIYLGFWVMASTIHFAVYLYLAAALFAYTLKLKELEPLILPIAGLCFFVGMIPENYVETVFKFREGYFNIYSLIFFFLPILLWSISRWKGRNSG